MARIITVNLERHGVHEINVDDYEKFRGTNAKAKMAAVDIREKLTDYHFSEKRKIEYAIFDVLHAEGIE